MAGSGADWSAYDVFMRGALGGVANATTMIWTNPLDVLKIRFQTRGELQHATLHQRATMWTLARQILTEEGAPGLFKGLSVSILRELTFSSARMGLYEPIKQLLTPRSAAAGGESPLPPAQLTFGRKVVAGVVSGALAASLFNPTDILKGVRETAFRAQRSCARGSGLTRNSGQRSCVRA